LPEERLLAAGVAQVECESEFVTATTGAPADGGDRDVGRLGEFQHHVGPWRKLILALWRREVGGRSEVEVVEKEVRHAAVEHDDLDVRVGREFVDDL
jgi:hypothetical protein